MLAMTLRIRKNKYEKTLHFGNAAKHVTTGQPGSVSVLCSYKIRSLE